MSYGDLGVAPQPEPLPQAEQNKILTPDDPWTDKRAQEIVKSDFAYAESYRTHAHDWRYRNADELYLAWAGQRYWDGTRVPRSSIGIYTVFSQVEAMLPQIVDTVFSTDNFHFKAEQPSDDASENELTVLAWRELIVRQLDEAKIREQGRRSTKSTGIYGNGVLECGIEEVDQEIIEFKKTVKTDTRIIQHPNPMIGPVPVQVNPRPQFKRSITTEKVQKPYVRYVSIKDFYVDPNSESTSLQDAGYVIKRVYMRASEVKALRKQDKFNIPDDDTLTKMSKAKTTANQDVTKLSAELYRYNLWNPAQDYSSDPGQKRIEVIEYTTKDRKIWMLGREHVIYNQPNRYGRINYFSSCYADVPDRWHALAISDIAEGEQRLQQAITNGRIDELALAIHPPMLKRRGVTIPAYQLKRRPGVVIECENPDGDMKQMEVTNVTQNAFVEVDASQRRVQSMTGVSDIAGLGGASTTGGNSANRTATGVNTQVGATQGRMTYLAATIEENQVQPVVNFMLYLNRKFLDMKTAAYWLQADPRFKKLDPEKVMNTVVFAECRGSIKMKARMGLMQAYPILSQTFLNPEFLSLMGQQSKMVLNTRTVEETLVDAIDYVPRQPWFVAMTPEQEKAQKQPPPEAMLKMQMEQAKLQSQGEIVDKRNQVHLIETILKEGFGIHSKAMELDDKHAQSQNDNLSSLAETIVNALSSQQSAGAGGEGAGADSGTGE